MPFVFQKKYAWGVVAAWKIDESEDALISFVNQSDLDSISGIGSSSKRVERLSWRALLRRVSPDIGVVEYDQYGAPHVCGAHLSVSHNSEYAVIALSESARCAIDVELCSRNFDKILSRYVSKEEEIIIGLPNLDGDERQRTMCAIWCAKEVLYKYSSRDSLDLLLNLKIKYYDSALIIGEILVQGESTVLSMDVLELGESLLVFTGDSSLKI